MAKIQRLLITEEASNVGRQFGKKISVWEFRRVVDFMFPRATLDLQRILNYRTVTDDDIGINVTELQRLSRPPLEVVS